MFSAVIWSKQHYYLHFFWFLKLWNILIFMLSIWYNACKLLLCRIVDSHQDVVLLFKVLRERGGFEDLGWMLFSSTCSVVLKIESILGKALYHWDISLTFFLLFTLMETLIKFPREALNLPSSCLNPLCSELQSCTSRHGWFPMLFLY